MLKSFKAWLQAREEEAERQELFERGYGYACTELLLYDRDPIEGTIARNAFDKGVDKAIRDICNLRNQVSDEPTKSEPDPLAGITFSPWANYVAQDGDGEWCEYEADPEPDENVIPGCWCNRTKQWGRLLWTGEPNPNWQQTKRKL